MILLLHESSADHVHESVASLIYCAKCTDDIGSLNRFKSLDSQSLSCEMSADDSNAGFHRFQSLFLVLTSQL
jgi:hypothetical protein